MEPKIPDYPDQLRKIMGRKVWKDTINRISADESKWSAGYFVKPTRDNCDIILHVILLEDELKGWAEAFLNG